MQKLKNLEDAEEEIFVTEFLSTDSEIKAKSLNLSCFQKKKGFEVTEKRTLFSGKCSTSKEHKLWSGRMKIGFGLREFLLLGDGIIRSFESLWLVLR